MCQAKAGRADYAKFRYCLLHDPNCTKTASGIASIRVAAAVFSKAKILAGMAAGRAVIHLILKMPVSAIRAFLYPALRIHRETICVYHRAASINDFCFQSTAGSDLCNSADIIFFFLFPVRKQSAKLIVRFASAYFTEAGVWGIDVMADPEEGFITAEVINRQPADLAVPGVVPEILISANRAEKDTVLLICQGSGIFDNPNALFCSLREILPAYFAILRGGGNLTVSALRAGFAGRRQAQVKPFQIVQPFKASLVRDQKLL